MTDKLVKADPLETRLVQQRTFSREELANLLSHAEALHSSDSTRQGLAELESIKESPDGFSADTLYSVAQELSIPKSHVDKAISLWYPSREQQNKELITHCAKPTSTVLRNAYYTVLNRTTENVPNLVLDPTHLQGREPQDYPRINFSIAGIKKQKKGIFRRRLVDVITKNRLAFMQFTSFSRYKVQVVSYSPSFLHIFGDAILELNNNFKRLNIEYSVEQRYPFNI